MRTRPAALALLVTAAFALACTGKGEGRRVGRIFTGPRDGWTATRFEFREYLNHSGHANDWTLVTDARYDGETVWTFMNEENRLSAAQMPGIDAGLVTAPDGWSVDLDWSIQLTGAGDPYLSMFLYEDAVFPQGSWDFDLPKLEADAMTWTMDTWSGDGSRRLQAELDLEAR